MLFEVLNQELFKEAAQEATLSELLEDHWSRCCWFQIWNVSLSEKNMQEFCNLFVRLQKGYTIFRADSSGWLSHSSNWIAFPKIVIIPLKKLKTPPDHVFKNYNFQRWLSTMIQGLISDGNALKKGSMFHHGSLTYSPIWSCIRYIAPKTLGELFLFSLSKTQMGFGKRPFLGAVWWAPPPKKTPSQMHLLSAI